MSYLYYDPQEWGLEVVGELEFSDGCYQFDTLVVWKDKKNRKVYYAEDSGCSCPVPFEECRSVDDLTEISSVTLQEFRSHIVDRCSSNYSHAALADGRKLVSKVAQLLARY